MNKAWSSLALGFVLCLPLLAGAEEVLVVDLGEPEPTPTLTPLPPTPTPEPATPTPVPVEPTVQATVAGAVQAEAVTSTAASADLGQVRFDGAASEDDGLMIIAPGSASPEDSLESFGIDSPYNWKGRDRQTLSGPAAGDEAMELSAPETSDLTDRVRVETGQGEALPTAGDYDQVERAGLVLTAAEHRVDGRIGRTLSGSVFATKGQLVALRMEPGQQIYPGSVYTAFREHGMLRTGDEDAREVGMLIIPSGLLRVVRIEGEEVLAKVERQFGSVREGDLVRLRDPERLRYYNSLRQGGSPPAELRGEVLAVMPPKQVAKLGDVVYLGLGRAHGAYPGLRLLLSREGGGVGKQGMRELRQSGRLGQVELVNVTREASVARVIKTIGEVRVGDQVRFR
jgi:hypothetical protein